MTYNISARSLRNHILTLESCKSYKTEANLDRALVRIGLDCFTMGEEKYSPMRYIKCRTPDGGWTAIFMVSEFFRINNTGGYVGLASEHGFMSV